MTHQGVESGAIPERQVSAVQYQSTLTRRAFLGLIAGVSFAVAGCGTSAQDHEPPTTYEPDADPAPSTTKNTMPETSQSPAETYPLHTDIIASVFWIGEGASKANGHITNVTTEWDSNAAERFGQPDGPTQSRQGILSEYDVPRDSFGVPTSFVPEHNPFYFALPAGEFTPKGPVPGAREQSPWADEVPGFGDERSLFKGRWAVIENAHGTKVYAQWLDVGPSFDEDPKDYDYVFGDGSQQPANQPDANTGNLGAGIDLSPAAAIRLGFHDGSIQVSWRFVDESEVPTDDPARKYSAIDNKTYWEK